MFEGKYAYLYDMFHATKNYEMEVDSIIRLLGAGMNSKITGFDFGCGTGSHAIAFLKHGISIDGYDLSQDMVEIAKAKAPQLSFGSNYLDFDGTYDFTYSLFDVLSYQITKDDAKELIRRLFEKTKPGGVTLIDSWNSEGVKISPPLENLRSVDTPDGVIVRKVSPRAVTRENIYKLDISLLAASTGEVLLSSVHSLRAWSPIEIIKIMKDVGYGGFTTYNPSAVALESVPADWRFGIRAEKE